MGGSRRMDDGSFLFSFRIILALCSILLVWTNYRRHLRDYYVMATKQLLFVSTSSSLILDDGVVSPSFERPISYSLQRENTFQNTYNLYYRCGDRTPLHADMEHILNFTTFVDIDKKLLFMGDSVSVQNAQGFQEAARVNKTQRTVLRYSWGTHEGLFVAPTSRGGVVAGWRITDLLRSSRENKPLPNSGGGGWVKSDVNAILAYNYTLSNGTETHTLGSFDTIIYRIPHGWIKLRDVTRDAIHETVQLAHDLFGITNVIFLTLPFISNILTRDDLALLFETNAIIRDYASLYHNKTNNHHNGNTSIDGVQNVLVLDFGPFADSLTQWNARLLGFNASSIETSDYLFERLQCCPRRGFQRAIAQVCAEKVAHNAKDCPRNMFSLDGMHWCSETLNGRLNGGLACLLGCLYNSQSAQNVGTCEKHCNNKFMSLGDGLAAPSTRPDRGQRLDRTFNKVPYRWRNSRK
mmetsp:Transcript_16012/g.34834  ORF Transcript_16012/g.34834 Transcript_16012/m.34834 type:complete len:465 (-) Transcript_16012:38-1432(-)